MSYSYKFQGSTVQLDVDPTVVAIRFDSSKPKSQWAKAASAAGTTPLANRFDIPNEKFTIIPIASLLPSMDKFNSTLGNLKASATVSRAVPVFRVGVNQVVATDRISVGFVDNNAKSQFLAENRFEIVDEWDDGATFRLPDGQNVFDVLADLENAQELSYSEPDFVTIGRHIPQAANALVRPASIDPMITGQYAMRITQAQDAWGLVAADPQVVIAILDEGVDTLHPDLQAKVSASYDAVDNDEFQEPNRWDGHGTACAGLAAADSNNGVGIRGVAGGCSIMAVRIAYSESPQSNWVTNDDWIRRGIEKAWTGGADVISNSWGGGAPSNKIAREFEKARTRGRGGKGCVIVIAAGNDYGSVSFPATLPNILSVSATNQYDEAKTPTSQDRENWWGTNHGPEISVGAPGVHNLTTDISSGDGYDPTDYTTTFNGTSSATPIVAGACALLLSAKSSLTEAEVRAIIVGTADKVGQYPYTNGRNNFFGEGRLNVLSAVQQVLNG